FRDFFSVYRTAIFADRRIVSKYRFEGPKPLSCRAGNVSRGLNAVVHLLHNGRNSRVSKKDRRVLRQTKVIGKLLTADFAISYFECSSIELLFQPRAHGGNIGFVNRLFAAN